MHLITRPRLLEDAKGFPKDIQKEVRAWCSVVKKAEWQCLDDIRSTYSRSVDKVGNFLVFNIKTCRLIVGFNYESQTIYYKYFLTHDEYDKEEWKNDPYFKKVEKE